MGLSRKEYIRQWKLANADRERANIRRWKDSNLEHERAIQKEWRESNPTYQVEWSEANRGARNAMQARYHASKLKATPSWLTKAQLKEINDFYDLAKDLQWLSDPCDPLEVDHIVPLQGENVSGLHVPWNLQIIPKSLNCSKKNKHG